MTVLTRRQFRQHWEGIMPGIAQDGSALWLMEESYGKKSRWFVCTRPLGTESELMVEGLSPKHEYWLWCHRHCAGQILCYSTDHENQEEWWGFSHHADIVLWMLKWAR
jgi:hypothetical protein